MQCAQHSLNGTKNKEESVYNTVSGTDWDWRNPLDVQREIQLMSLRNAVLDQYWVEEKKKKKEKAEAERVEKERQRQLSRLEISKKAYKEAYCVVANEACDPLTAAKHCVVQLTLSLDVLVRAAGRAGAACLFQLLVDCAGRLTMDESVDKRK